MKRVLVRIAAALAALFVLIQLVPAGRTNPPVTQALAAAPEVLSILKRSCYDCHSNETRWPWYAYVAPVSWLVVHDVDEGREHLNFSHWGGYDAKKRISKAAEVIEEIENGEMPLAQYLWLHGDARIAPEELEVLRAWELNVE